MPGSEDRGHVHRHSTRHRHSTDRLHGTDPRYAEAAARRPPHAIDGNAERSVSRSGSGTPVGGLAVCG
ncbi:hypothetical protein ABZZ16_34490, partial [Streptomyces sp. NPDC006386]|uniref:hypothetical protein n=1 Tax=Streptomyces sp. NPDC006386 TaxID=3156762 RepID=UPI00339E5B0D